MNGDVVVVSFNYRLGAFGFLSLEREDAPGNAGLKDQTLALQWVHDNIDSFGGDPNNVTLIGVSAGGASVHFQLLCPPSRGLFHKAIIQCGFANNPWANQEAPRETALELAKALGCTSEDSDEVLKFLKSASADDIVAGTHKLCMAERKKVPDFVFTPSVEVSGAESSLPDLPDNLMKRGEFAQVPVILGCSVREGTVVTMFNGISDKAFEFINNNPEVLVPSFLGLNQRSVDKKEAENEIWEFYFKGEPLCWDTVHQYLICQSDIQFNFGMEQTRSYLVEKSTAPVYTYLYTDHSRCICHLTFQGELSKLISSGPSLLKLVVFGTISPMILDVLRTVHTLWLGLGACCWRACGGDGWCCLLRSCETCHGADSLYTVKSEMIKTPELSPEGKEVISKHVKAWNNFATFG
ncbi:hypothetical protein J6590_093199 [Homalodisca vitripennis]|nr:hypothetical protein J6590_093199 [Homalodisca vitripennis]